MFCAYLIDFKPLDSSVDDGPVLRENVHEILFGHDCIDLEIENNEG